MSRPPLDSAATTSAATSSQDYTAPLILHSDDDAHGDDARASLSRDLSPCSSLASSPAPAPRVNATRSDTSRDSFPSIEQDCTNISTLVFEERAKLFVSEAPPYCTQLLSPLDDSTATDYDSLLAQRVLHYTTTELPLLLSSNAHRRRDLAALAIESRNPLSRLNALPTLGPLQMVEQYVQRAAFRAGVVNSSGPGRLLCSSPVVREAQDALYHVGELSNGKLVACADSGRSFFLQVFDGLLNLQRTVASPLPIVAVVDEMVVTQRDDIAFVADGVGRIMHIDGTLLARCGGKDKCGDARSVTQLADGAFAVLLQSNRGVRVYSGNLELQHSFILDEHHECGYARRVRVTSDDHIVVALEDGVQWYRRDGTLLGHFDWARAPEKDVDASGISVDAESNIVISDSNLDSVLVFRPDGMFVRSLRAKAFEPWGLAITAEGRVALCNSGGGHSCVQLWA